MSVCLVIFTLIFAVMIFGLVLLKFCYIRCESYVCLVGRTAIVTGGCSGLGYHIVLSLASRGCKVIIVDKIINEDIKNQIIHETNNPNIVLEYANFASFSSVKRFVEKIKRSESKLDILVNNAGIARCSDTPTEDGLNELMQINHYSAFLLTHLLVDLLKKSDDARIIFTSSISSFNHFLLPPDVNSKTIKDPPLRNMDYSNSKFCNLVVSDMFARKLKKWNITSNAYHPGIARTNIYVQLKQLLDYSRIQDFLVLLISSVLLFAANDPKIAAQTAVNLCVSKELKNVSGTFYGKYFPNVKPRLAKNETFCDMIWKASENAVQLKPEEKLD